MRTVKLVLGIGYLLTALLLGGFTILFLLDLGSFEPLLAFGIALIPSILALSLIWAGRFLIVRRNSPIPQKARILILLPLLSIAILLAGAPYFIKPGCTSAANACINNLREIDAAANELALEKNLRTGDKINYPDDLTPYIKLNKDGRIPPCPQGGVYSLKKVGDAPTCSLGTTVTPAHVLP